MRTRHCIGLLLRGCATTNAPKPTSLGAPQKGWSKKEIIRCLKRAIVREVYRVICTKRSTPQPRDLRRDELKELRIAKQLTQVYVAQHLGCAPARNSDIETGKRPLTELASAYEKFLKAA